MNQEWLARVTENDVAAALIFNEVCKIVKEKKFGG